MKMNWNLILVLSAVALIRPLMSILGVTEVIGQPYASLTLTLLITMVWIAAAVIGGVENPIMTLVMTGIFYALFVIILSGILSPLLMGGLMGPLTNPFAVISVFMTNIIWGGITGIIAWVIMKMMK